MQHKIIPMNNNPYNNDNQQDDILSEPAVAYGNEVIEHIKEKPAWFDENFERLKAEADAKFGEKELMSVDEYFGKLRYIVDGLYEVQSQH